MDGLRFLVKIFGMWNYYSSHSLLFLWKKTGTADCFFKYVYLAWFCQENTILSGVR